MLSVVEDLLSSRSYTIADRHAVIDAVDLAKRFQLEFSDALIAGLNRAAGCSSTVTFDDTAAKSPIFIKADAV